MQHSTRRQSQAYLPSLHSLATRISSTSIWFCIFFMTRSFSRDLRLYATTAMMMMNRTKAPPPAKARITVKLNVKVVDPSYFSSPITKVALCVDFSYNKTNGKNSFEKTVTILRQVAALSSITVANESQLLSLIRSWS